MAFSEVTHRSPDSRQVFAGLNSKLCWVFHRREGISNCKKREDDQRPAPLTSWWLQRVLTFKDCKDQLPSCPQQPRYLWADRGTGALKPTCPKSHINEEAEPGSKRLQSDPRGHILNHCAILPQRRLRDQPSRRHESKQGKENEDMPTCARCES